jgi:acyl carrier protein
MGIDLFDVTVRIEKSFQIELSDEDMRGLVRGQDIAIGDLYNLILKKKWLRDVGRYDWRLNEQLWSTMQGVLHSVTDVPLNQIELHLALESLFPRPTRRCAWDALREACPYRVKELDYPQGARVAGFLLAVGVVLIEQFQIWRMPGANWFWPLLGLLAVWMVSETYLKIMSICAPLRNRFPAGMRTVKDLCRIVMATNYVEICNRVKIPLDQRCVVIWEELVEILVAALGVDPEEVTYRSLLFRDLGAS